MENYLSEYVYAHVHVYICIPVHTCIVWRDVLRELSPFSSRAPSRKLRARDLCILFYYNLKNGFIISQTPMQTHEIFKKSI